MISCQSAKPRFFRSVSAKYVFSVLSFVSVATVCFGPFLRFYCDDVGNKRLHSKLCHSSAMIGLLLNFLLAKAGCKLEDS